MQGSVEDAAGVAADEQESRRWEDQQLAAHVLRRLREERAELGRLRSVRVSFESYQAVQTEGAARDLSFVEERLRKMCSELVPDEDTVMDKGNVRAQGILQHMQHQHWGLQAACWPARISGVSTRSTTRENGISSLAAGEAHQVSGGHMQLPQQAAGDAEQAVHVSQIPRNSGDTFVLFADWTEACKADEHLKELYEYLSAGNSRAGFGLYR